VKQDAEALRWASLKVRAQLGLGARGSRQLQLVE